MDENEISRRIVDCAVGLHKTLGPGLLENVYEVCLAHDLRKAGLKVQRQLSMPLVYDGIMIEAAYRLDLLVSDLVVIEVKSVQAILDVHKAQLLSYLRLGGYKLGFVLNFNVALMRDGIHRVANGL